VAVTHSGTLPARTGAARSARLVRIALFGLPGSGKSTACRELLGILERRGQPAVLLKLAEPLYELQNLIYSYCGVPLHDRYRQDGALLNFLGAHLRSINPDVLTDHFASRQRAAEVDAAEAGKTRLFVLCDDMRPVDAPFMRARGFTLVRVDAPRATRERRLAGRGDSTRGSSSHSTELGVDETEHDLLVTNDGTIEALRASLEDILAGLGG
jgi:GTPase SAR1 family protein